MDWQRDVADTLADLEARTREVGFKPRVEDVGHVRRVGDGVAIVDGLQGAMADEIVAFANGEQGQVFDLNRDAAACVLYGPEAGIAAGSLVFRTGRTPTMPVGEALLGRVVDALGRPLDGLGPLLGLESRPMEQDAPGALDRQPIRQPLFTGIKAVDAAIPIGLGQRELILGDRETGKSGIAIDTIINQRHSGVVCIYVSVGHKRSSVVELIDELRQHDALAHTVVIVAGATDPLSLVYLAPYAGCTLAEWFAYRGGHALIVYDDLTRHAEAYRSLSLILRRPPGREAYPGDIFSAHARLMERAFKLSEARGAGSVTALPIIETQQGDIASFISTNLISMTDGQLYLDTGLFTQAQLPAIDIGRSVSRVGRDAQPGAMREAAANLRLEIAQYEEVKGFARFGAILDETTRAQIARGERLTRVLGQRERAVVPLTVQVAELWALKSGLLDDLAAASIPQFEERLLGLAAEFAHLHSQIVAAPGIGPELSRDLHRWVARAKAQLGVPAG